MFECNLLKKKNPILIAHGIDIPGWDKSTYTKTAGATSRIVEDGSTVFDFASDVTNWLRIPYQNTPSIVAEQLDITVRFNVRAIPAAAGRCVLVSRYRQGQDVSSWFLAIQKSGVVGLAMNNVTTLSTATSNFGVENTVRLTRIGDVFTVYLNGIQVIQVTRTGTYTSAHDWVFGSYLSTGNVVLTNSPAFPADWTLLGITVKPYSP